MNMKENIKTESIPKVKGLVIKAIKEAKIDSSNNKRTFFHWHKFYNYSINPLNLLNPEEDFKDEDLNLFINRENEIKLISGYIGQVNKNLNGIHLAIVGSKGIGKHTSMKIISSILINSFPELYFEFYNYQFLYDFKKSEPISFKEMKKIHNNSLDIRIISCIGKNKWQFLEKIKEFKKNTKLIISIWDISEYPHADEIFVDKEIFFKNYTLKKTIDILEARVKKSLKSLNENKDYYKNLKENIIPKIASFSRGNLEVCFKLFEAIHQEGSNKGQKHIDLSIVDQKIQEFSKMKNAKLTRKENEIINYFIEKQNMKFLTTPNLVQDLNYNRTIAWTYLEKLTEKNILEKVQYGKPSKYKINDLFLIYYEEKIIDKMILSSS